MWIPAGGAPEVPLLGPDMSIGSWLKLRGFPAAAGRSSGHNHRAANGSAVAPAIAPRKRDHADRTTAPPQSSGQKAPTANGGYSNTAAALPENDQGPTPHMEPLQPSPDDTRIMVASSRLLSSQGHPHQVTEDVRTLLEYSRQLVERLGQGKAAKDEAERRHREDERRIQELEGRLAEEVVDKEEAARCRRGVKAQLRALEARVVKEVAGRERAERLLREGEGKLQKLEDRLAKEVAAREAVQQSYGEASTRNEGLVGQMEEQGRQHDTSLAELWDRNTVLEARLGEEAARVKQLEGQVSDAAAAGDEIGQRIAAAEKATNKAGRQLAVAEKALADDIAVREEAERQLVVVAGALEREVTAKEKAQVQLSEAASQQAVRLGEEREVARAEVAGLKQVVREQRALMHRLDRTNTRLWAHCAEEGLMRVSAILGNVCMGISGDRYRLHAERVFDDEHVATCSQRVALLLTRSMRCVT